MAMIEENWKVLTSLLPAGWRQMAWETVQFGDYVDFDHLTRY